MSARRVILASCHWALAAIAAVAVLCALAVRLLLPPSRNFVPAPARFGSFDD